VQKLIGETLDPHRNSSEQKQSLSIVARDSADSDPDCSEITSVLMNCWGPGSSGQWAGRCRLLWNQRNYYYCYCDHITAQALYLLYELAQVHSVQDDSSSCARSKSDVMILSCLKDQMTALRHYSRPASNPSTIIIIIISLFWKHKPSLECNANRPIDASTVHEAYSNFCAEHW